MMNDGKTEIRFKLDLGDRAMEATVRVPEAPVALPELLPVLHSFQDALMTVVEARARKAGTPASCRAGCGACCRQLVPVSEAEARYLFDYVDGLPAERQAAVRERFRAALARLEAAGVRKRIEAVPSDQQERDALALEYFRLGVACPFLEDERCSIYEQRPMKCREYLVSSPAAECSDPSPDRVARNPTGAKGAQILYRWVKGAARYLPLVLALDWVEKFPNVQFPIAPGADIFKAFLGSIQRQVRERKSSAGGLDSPPAG